MGGWELRQILAQNIKVYRGRRNWSQADLSDKTGLSIVYLSDIERGNKWPYLDTLIKLAEAFKVEVYELLKPENIPVPTATTFLAKFTEELNAILIKTFEITEKKALQSIAILRDEYLSKNI